MIVNGRLVLKYNSLAATLPVGVGRGGYHVDGTEDATLTLDDYRMMS